MPRKRPRGFTDLTSHEVEIMVHLRYQSIFEILNSLYMKKLLDTFEVRIDPPFTACDAVGNGEVKTPIGRMLCVRFEARNGTHWFQWNLSELCHELQRYTEDITLKTKGYGYKILPWGRFGDEWELDDGMC